MVDEAGLVAEDAGVHAFVFAEFECVEEVVFDQTLPDFLEADAVDHLA